MPADRLPARRDKRASASPMTPVLDKKYFHECDWIEPDDPEVCELLEQLDDLVFSALAGCDPSLQEVRELWPIAELVLGEGLLRESRAQYLFRANEIAHRGDNGDSPCPRRLAALAIITMLSG